MTPPTSEPTQFKAEIRQLLDILIHSLYSDREIFLRELISNASDALNRLRFEMLTNRDILEPDAELAIRISADKDARILRISDSGIGMTEAELATNLGTIAQSGAREFIQAAKEGTENLSDIIGQFGVGFYSCFMAAESVRVISRSYRKDAAAAAWVSGGGDTFTLEEAEREHRGTTIEITLKEDAVEFADEWRLKQIIRMHSDFVAYPIYVGEDEEPTNQRTALWRQSPRELDDEKYNEFFKQMTLDADAPLARAHVITDAPVQLYALLFVPPSTEKGMLALRREDGLKLYARKVLIQEYTKDLLPEYFRFIHGIVDSEDIPLNVSREMVQSSPVMQRIKKVLTGRVVSMIEGIAKDEENPQAYDTFWERFGSFIKEGVASDQADGKNLYNLLRFKTTKTDGAWRSLKDYIADVKPGQQKIYYLLGEDSRTLNRSPHLDYFRKNGYEVLLLGDLIDSFMILGIPEFEGFDLVNVAAADLELPAAEENAETEPADTLDETERDALVERFRAVLGDRVSDVRTTTRLSDSMARLVDPEGALNQEMQRVYRLMDRAFEAPRKVLELNPKHPMLGRIAALQDDALAALFIEQIYENTLLIEGIHPDPAGMIPRLESLMKAALD